MPLFNFKLTEHLPDKPVTYRIVSFYGQTRQIAMKHARDVYGNDKYYSLDYEISK